MIIDVATAIMTRYNQVVSTGTALRAVLTGGLWFTQAKPDVSFPYGVFTWDGSNIDEICGTRENAIETAQITVSVYSKNDDGGAEIFDIAEKFMLHYDWCSLTYPDADYAHIACKRTSIINRGKLDNIWQIDLNYEVMFSHS